MLSIVHRTFEVEGVYLTHVGGSPSRVNVRIHRKPTVERLTYGDFDDSAAGSWAAEDIIIFDLAQVAKPLNNAFLIVGPEEGYIINSTKPAQDGYQGTAVSEMTVAQITALLGQVDTASPVWEGIV